MFLVSACSIEPRKVHYGEDACNFCKMIAVDQRYGAELVTDKGKNYIFDSVECMINYKNQHKDVNFPIIMVTPITTPDRLARASECKYLITKDLPSPMGANLSAILPDQADSLLQAHPGKLYSWNELNDYFNNK